MTTPSATTRTSDVRINLARRPSPGAYGLDRVIDDLTRCNRQPEVLRLSCGHSSVGVFPYNVIAAKKVLNFLTDDTQLTR